VKPSSKLLQITLLLISLQTTGTLGQTADQAATCKSKNSHIATAYCRLLGDEFLRKRFPDDYPLGDTLVKPLDSPIEFTEAFFDVAYDYVLTAKLKSDAYQAAANAAAQVLSTKATVPQPGANASASGSTSLVAKPTTTDLISLAAESGAFTDTVNGNTLTAKANVNGLRRYLSDENFAELNPTKAKDLLQHVTLAATFDIAQTGSTAATSTGQATSSTPTNIQSIIVPSNNLSFSGLTVSASVYRPYTPTSPGFITKWNTAIKQNSTAILTASGQLFKDYNQLVPDESRKTIYAGPAFMAALHLWKTAAGEDEKNGDFSKFVDDYITFMNALATALRSQIGTDFDQYILTVATNISNLQTVRNTVLDSARGSLATFTYSYATPTGKPATHDLTAIFGYVWKTGDQLTFNGAGSWYATIPPGAKYGRVRDYQVTGEYDHPFGKDKTSPRAIFSVAGYGQYQYTANILNITVANVVPGTDITVPSNSQVFTSTPGWLGVAQTKLSFNIGKGATIPVAVKWSNKTDLLSGSDWKGQFGFSYDLSALSSILAPK